MTKLLPIEVWFATSLLILCAVPAQAQEKPPRLGTEFGFGLFQQRCMNCHGSSTGTKSAPDPSTLRQLAPEAIYDALTSGTMKVQGQNLSDEQRRLIAESLSGRRLGSAQ